MRIIAGESKGHPIKAPEGAGTRPTTDRVREALFSRLYSRLGGFAHLRVLDAFAGSGALALEALSRGAESAVVVEQAVAAQKVLRANVRALGYESRVTLLAGAVERQDTRFAAAGPFGLALLDPPYALGSQEVYALVENWRKRGILEETATILYEHSRDTQVLWAGYTLLSQQRYGDTCVSMLTYDLTVDHEGESA